MSSPVLEELRRAIGPEAVDDSAETLTELGSDITENPSGHPEVVVRPQSAAEVREVLLVANRHKVPVVPMMANTNLGGLAVPVRGGIVLSLARMDRILEVSEEDQYAVLEPGVTWQQISDYLEAHHPRLRFAYPLSPPDTGVVPNFLLDGLVNLSLRHGSAAHWVNALEVVLPNGDLLRTGHSAFGSLPCTNAPFPGLEGLFTSFQGTTGVVVKMAVQLWPERTYRKRLFLMGHTVEGGFALVRKLSRSDLIDDLGVLSLPTGKMLFGDYRPTYRDPAEPILFIYVDLSSDYARDFACKQEIIAELVAEQRRCGQVFQGPLDIEQLVRLEPRFGKFARFPTRLDFLLDHPGGGLTWIGTYGPVSRYEEGFLRGSELMQRHGLPPVIVARPMRGGHFGVLRWITVFDRRSTADVEATRKLNRELADLAVSLGFFPYKTPQWVWDRFRDRVDPTFARVVRQVRDMLDPNGIMNPGHLDI